MISSIGKKIHSVFFRKSSGGKSERSRLFSNIYREKKWGGQHTAGTDFFSGAGSLPANTKDYEDFVAQFIDQNDVQSIVDIGCGDFQVANRILNRLERKVSYLGCDLVPELISRNRKRFSSKTVHFKVLDAVTDDIPQADLIIIREVLQHLSNSSISKVLDKIGATKYSLITNTYHVDMVQPNIDIEEGVGTRAGRRSGIDLRHPPFEVGAQEVLLVRHSAHPLSRIQTLLLAAEE